jgi:hypothetical protein
MPNSSERAQVSVQRTDANLGHPAKNAERMGHRNWNCPTQAKERLEWATRPPISVSFQTLCFYFTSGSSTAFTLTCPLETAIFRSQGLKPDFFTDI